MSTLKIGDKVWWKGGFGGGPVTQWQQLKKLKSLVAIKYGEMVDEVDWDRSI